MVFEMFRKRKIQILKVLLILKTVRITLLA